MEEAMREGPMREGEARRRHSRERDGASPEAAAGAGRSRTAPSTRALTRVAFTVTGLGLALTLGCSERSFCPDSTVTREQMASFLARSLNL